MHEESDRLQWIGLRFGCRLGVTATERRRLQPVWLDIALYGDWRRAGLRDRLEDTVDYAALAAELRRELDGREFRLLEAVAETAAAVCLRDPRVVAVELQAAKRPPASVKGLTRFAVTVRRTRPRRVARDALNH